MMKILSWPRCRAGAHRELGISELAARSRRTWDCGRRQRREAPSGATLNFSCPKLELRLLLDTGEKRRSRS